MTDEKFQGTFSETMVDLNQGDLVESYISHTRGGTHSLQDGEKGTVLEVRYLGNGID